MTLHVEYIDRIKNFKKSIIISYPLIALMGNGDKDNEFADGGPTLIKIDASLTINLDIAYILCSLQANSIEPNIGRKPNVIQAMDSIISI
jgi:hypothetical protein